MANLNMCNFNLMLTPTGISAGLRLSDLGDRHAGDEAPLLFADAVPEIIIDFHSNPFYLMY